MAGDPDQLPTERASRLDAVLTACGLEEIWIARPDSFAWLTGGSNVVDRASQIGVAVARYNGSLSVVTNDIEITRLAEEELPDVPVESYPWHTSSLAETVAERSSDRAAADFPVSGLESFDAAGLRQPLTPEDITAYRELGTDVAAAVETVCRDCEPADSELEVAAALRGHLAAVGADTPVALVGGAERAPRYRHYTPTTSEIGDYALVSVTARREGLYASCTRTVAFDPPPWLLDRHAAASRVETTAIGATRRVGREGGSSGDVFAAIRAAYAEVGHEGEWRSHHQGGATGYAGREWIATPEGDESVHLPAAYAWNPTVRGAKSEDTVLVTRDGVEVLTRAEGWPEREVPAITCELTLSRPDVLQR
jgi:Xaa-Pro aminopeptidase